MTLKTSLDWQDIRAELVKTVSALPYNRDLRHMLFNIDKMVVRLAQVEVEARRTRRDSTKSEEYRAVIAAIENFEQYCMLATLLR
jgi:hypothetical protein